MVHEPGQSEAGDVNPDDVIEMDPESFRVNTVDADAWQHFGDETTVVDLGPEDIIDMATQTETERTAETAEIGPEVQANKNWIARAREEGVKRYLAGWPKRNPGKSMAAVYLLTQVPAMMGYPSEIGSQLGTVTSGAAFLIGGGSYAKSRYNGWQERRREKRANKQAADAEALRQRLAGNAG